MKKMIDIIGIDRKGDEFSFKSKCDLLYYEGPLLTLFWGMGELITMCKWCDFDDYNHRWMFIYVTTKDMIRYFKKEITLRDLFKSKEYCVILDGMVEEYYNLVFAKIIDIPDEYFPMSNSYCDIGSFTKEGQLLASNTLRDNLCKN